MSLISYGTCSILLDAWSIRVVLWSDLEHHYFLSLCILYVGDIIFKQEYCHDGDGYRTS